jgi:hypothetical protein
MRTVEFDLELEFLAPSGEHVSHQGPFRCSMPVPFGVSSSMRVEGQTVFEGRRVPLSFDLPIDRGGAIPTITIKSRLEAKATDTIPGSGIIKRVAFSDGRTATVSEGEPQGLRHRVSAPREVEILVCGERQAWTTR